MGLFTKETCAHCGGKAGKLLSTKLDDGSYICNKCLEHYPFEFKMYMTSSVKSYNDFLRFISHTEENKRKLNEFDFSCNFLNYVYYDATHNWFVFSSNNYSMPDELIENNAEVFAGKDLVYIDFWNEAEVKEGGLGNKAYIDTTLTVAFNNEWYPCAIKQKIVKGAKQRVTLFGATAAGKYSKEAENSTTALAVLLSQTLINNGVNYPTDLGGKFSTNVELAPYATYFRAMRRLKDADVFDSLELSERLGEIAPNAIVKSKIKKEFFK